MISVTSLTAVAYLKYIYNYFNTITMFVTNFILFIPVKKCKLG